MLSLHRWQIHEGNLADLHHLTLETKTSVLPSSNAQDITNLQTPLSTLEATEGTLFFFQSSINQ